MTSDSARAPAPAHDQKDGDASFLDGGSDMAILIRSLDWTNSPLGPIERWPQSLRTAVSGLAKTMSRELGTFGVTVNNVCPAHVMTARLREVAAPGHADAHGTKIVRTDRLVVPVGVVLLLLRLLLSVFPTDLLGLLLMISLLKSSAHQSNRFADACL